MDYTLLESFALLPGDRICSYGCCLHMDVCSMLGAAVPCDLCWPRSLLPSLALARVLGAALCVLLPAKFRGLQGSPAVLCPRWLHFCLGTQSPHPQALDIL